jgi:nitroreductase
MTNEVIQAIKKRRSVRTFDEKSIDDDTLCEIIQAGRYAPSALNRQPWKFIVISNKKLIKEIVIMVKKELKNILKKRFYKKYSIPELKNEEIVQHVLAFALSKEDIIFFDAPVLLFILTQDRLFYDESCACCAQNMMLAAHSLGIGSCWIGFASVLGMNKAMMQKIKVPEGYHISAALVFGYQKGNPERASIRKVEADVIEWFK